MTNKKTNDIILVDKERRVKKMARSPEAIKRAKAKYNEKVNRITIAFYPTELEIWNKLQTQENKQGYIKDLIKKDIQ